MRELGHLSTALQVRRRSPHPKRTPSARSKRAAPGPAFLLRFDQVLAPPNVSDPKTVSRADPECGAACSSSAPASPSEESVPTPPARVASDPSRVSELVQLRRPPAGRSFK